MSANQPIGQNPYRCTRPGCGQVLSSHEEQPEHSLATHCNCSGTWSPPTPHEGHGIASNNEVDETYGTFSSHSVVR